MLGLLQAAALLTFSYLTLARELDIRQLSMLRDKADHARRLALDESDGASMRANASRFLEIVESHPDLHLMIARAGSPVPWLALSLEARESLFHLRRDVWSSGGTVAWRAPPDDRPMISFARSAQTRNGETYEIVMTADLTTDRRLLRGFLLAFLTTAPLTLALVGVSALAIAKFGLRPLNRFAGITTHITTHDLTTRIDTIGLPDELSGLAIAFNAMLSRLDDGVRRLSEYSSDLAHELHTPLATLLGATQVALSQPRSKEELVDVLVANVEELQRLSRLVDDMLFLAQADDAQAALDWVDLELAEEASNLADFMGLLAQEREMTIDVTGTAPAKADRQLVRRVLINLLSNALRHGTPGSIVRVHAYDDGRSACLDVTNEGQPIALDHQLRLFERFYRADGSRSRGSGGSGLGLAIVKAIATLHGGTVRVRSDASTGTRFTLCLPKCPSRRVRSPTG
jgi:two-component system heavy metal sensor histidine kinase CusS